MIEATLPTMAQFATEAVQFAAQAGPSGDLPAQVPGFVSEILGAVGEAGSDAAGEAADGAAGNAPGK